MRLIFDGVSEATHEHLAQMRGTTIHNIADAIAQCDCGRYFYYGVVNDYPMPFYAWLPVRPWNRRLRRIIREQVK